MADIGTLERQMRKLNPNLPDAINDAIGKAMDEDDLRAGYKDILEAVLDAFDQVRDEIGELEGIYNNDIQRVKKHEVLNILRPWELVGEDGNRV